MSDVSAPTTVALDARRSVGVLSILFPHPGQPNAGLFIRERMFRVGERLNVQIIAPQPWFPGQGLIRRWKPFFRPKAPLHEVQKGVEVHHPRFFCVPGVLKWLDGLFLALATFPLFRRLKRDGRLDQIDAHFAYPDGYAATLLGAWLDVPVTITLRGTEVPLARTRLRRKLMVQALNRADHVISVSDSLRRHVRALGLNHDRITVVGNGVDLEKFEMEDKTKAREDLGIAPDRPVLISVGGLVERKGFHRVIELLPQLIKKYPGLLYLVVGGPSAEGDISEELKQQVRDLGLEEHVRFLGPVAPEKLRVPLSAADVFVLATSNEGWANVFLEAMACGLPVVTTDVGGNREVVRTQELGTVVPFGDPAELRTAIDDALEQDWDRQQIRRYAEDNAWDRRVDQLIGLFEGLGHRS